MKKIFLLSLVILSSYTYANDDQTLTSTEICWGATLPLDADYDGATDELKTSYTAQEIEGIYKNIMVLGSENNSALEQKKYICSILWPYFTFIIKGTYEQKELGTASQAFIEVFGTKIFIEQDLKGLGKKMQMIPVLKGFKGKGVENANPGAYKRFSNDSNNQFFLDIMDNNENVFKSLAGYLNVDQKTSLKNITTADLFGLITYLEVKGDLDEEYFPDMFLHSADLLTEFKKIQN